jgi:hypothetical protein
MTPRDSQRRLRPLARATLAIILALAAMAAVPPPPADADPIAPADVPAAAPTAGSNLPSPVTVKVKADPDEVTIGTPFRFTMEITAPTGMQIVMAQPTERIGAFDIIDFGDEPAQHGTGMTTITRWYRLAGFETGHKEIESPPVSYRAPGATELIEVPKDHTVVTVKSLLPEKTDGADIRDIKAPEPLPIDWRPYYIAAAAVAALAIVAALLWRVSRRGRAARALPPIPPHKIAYAELEKLRGRHLIEQGAFKEYYSTLSDIVRTYVERRFEVRAPEMTTEEFLTSSARNGRLQSGHRGVLGNFLTESDLVKFARHVPSIADSERAYDAAKRFVDETREPEFDGNGTVAAAAAAPRAPVTAPPPPTAGPSGDERWRGPDATR